MLIIFSSIIIIIILIEFQHNLGPSSPLTIKPSSLHIKKLPNKISIDFLVTISNKSRKKEIMVPEFKIQNKLLSQELIQNVEVSQSILTEHKELTNRKDNYWQAYVAKSRSSTSIKANITLKTNKQSTDLSLIESIWVEIYWKNYASFGLLNRYEAFAIPLNSPIYTNASNTLTHKQIIPYAIFKHGDKFLRYLKFFTGILFEKRAQMYL